MMKKSLLKKFSIWIKMLYLIVYQLNRYVK